MLIRATYPVAQTRLIRSWCRARIPTEHFTLRKGVANEILSRAQSGRFREDVKPFRTGLYAPKIDFAAVAGEPCRNSLRIHAREH